MQSIVYALGAGAGFTLALILMAGIREKLELASVPDLASGETRDTTAPARLRRRVSAAVPAVASHRAGACSAAPMSDRCPTYSVTSEERSNKMRLEDYDTGSSYTARVLSSHRITSAASSDEVREIVLEVERDDFDYKPGQSIGVIVSGNHDLGHQHHFRLYSVADTPGRQASGPPRVTLCVKRCNYIDDYSGEEYQGIASNFLCDLRQGDTATINGPFGIPFEVPADKRADLLLIGMGTGIAPFRALVKHIYQDVRDWQGKIRLFYGARSGLELLYMNDEKDDFAQYYDEQTFAAFKALSPRPHWADPFAMDYALEERSEEILAMLEDSRTHIYVAGREEILASLDRIFSRMLGSPESWARRKAELQAGRRWVELVY